MKRLLIAIDNSISALNAAKYGLDFAKRLNLEIGIAEITTYSMGNIDAGILPFDAEKAMQQRAKTYIDEIKQLYPDLLIQEFVPIGKPHIEIKKIINIWGADMLVIGHHTHSMLHKLFLKSVEAKLIANIEIPILIIPESYTI